MKIVHAMDTLCYLTPRTDGDHAPECLLESCIYMETANTIGQMLQQNKDRIVIEKTRSDQPSLGCLHTGRICFYVNRSIKF